VCTTMHRGGTTLLRPLARAVCAASLLVTGRITQAAQRASVRASARDTEADVRSTNVGWASRAFAALTAAAVTLSMAPDAALAKVRVCLWDLPAVQECTACGSLARGLSEHTATDHARNLQLQVKMSCERATPSCWLALRSEHWQCRMPLPACACSFSRSRPMR
jgi:hypothetical protein